MCTRVKNIKRTITPNKGTIIIGVITSRWCVWECLSYHRLFGQVFSFRYSTILYPHHSRATDDYSTLILTCVQYFFEPDEERKPSVCTKCAHTNTHTNIYIYWLILTRVRFEKCFAIMSHASRILFFSPRALHDRRGWLRALSNK